MKNNKFVKILSVLIAALFAFSLLSVSVFAESETAAADTTAAAETAASGAVEDAEGGIDISFDRLPANLGRMGVGMLCIIIVIGVLIGVTMVLNKVTASKKK